MCHLVASRSPRGPLAQCLNASMGARRPCSNNSCSDAALAGAARIPTVVEGQAVLQACLEAAAEWRATVPLALGWAPHHPAATYSLLQTQPTGAERESHSRAGTCKGAAANKHAAACAWAAALSSGSGPCTRHPCMLSSPALVLAASDRGWAGARGRRRSTQSTTTSCSAALPAARRRQPPPAATRAKPGQLRPSSLSPQAALSSHAAPRGPASAQR